AGGALATAGGSDAISKIGDLNVAALRGPGLLAALYGIVMMIATFVARAPIASARLVLLTLQSMMTLATGTGIGAAVASSRSVVQGLVGGVALAILAAPIGMLLTPRSHEFYR
ncbi:MAG: hypothetical protein EBU85_06300, partial [Actinobacteria bacterium]|nr:hypothetical protein [Actinomycetota bacterium]